MLGVLEHFSRDTVHSPTGTILFIYLCLGSEFFCAELLKADLCLFAVQCS